MTSLDLYEKFHIYILLLQNGRGEESLSYTTGNGNDHPHIEGRVL